MTDAEKTNAIRDYIAQTTGSEEWFKHYLGLIYTSGVRFVAQTTGAYWLIDLIASHILTKRQLRAEPFQVWRLTKEKDKWFVRAWSDTPGKSTRLAIQSFEYSDFPEELLPFDLWVESGTLLLPAER